MCVLGSGRQILCTFCANFEFTVILNQERERQLLQEIAEKRKAIDSAREKRAALESSISKKKIEIEAIGTKKDKASNLIYSLIALSVN